MPIQTYSIFKKLVQVCKIQVPQAVLESLEPIKVRRTFFFFSQLSISELPFFSLVFVTSQENDEAVKNFGIKHGIDMCKSLMACGFYCFHFYTLNLEKTVTGIIEGLSIERRHLPWTVSDPF